MNRADAIVEASYKYDDEYAYWSSLSPVQQALIPMPVKPPLYRQDSSTGLGQIFAATAIKAQNHAVDSKYISETKYQQNYNDIRRVWYKLKDDDTFNLNYILYVLLYEANRLGYSKAYVDYHPDMIEKLLSRYNGTGKGAQEYGAECYKWYSIFNKYK